jgi:copper homeostasis protein
MLEVVVETVEDAIAAQSGGAHQVEVKCDYQEYGLTPTAGMLEQICSNVTCDVLSMVRPHARSFIYSKTDLAAMASDIRRARQQRVRGFLIGCLTGENEVDTEAMKYLKDAAGDHDLHFHLAWELTPDPPSTLELLIDLGIKSVRISGGAGISGQAAENTARIRAYFERADGRIDFFLAGGITVDNLAQVVADTGISNVHAGSGVRKPQTRTGIVSEEKVRQMSQALLDAIKK